MTNRKLLLSHLLDIGGVATLNNLYSPEAKSYKGSLLFTRNLFKSYLKDGLIKKIDFIGKPRNPSHEVFYCLTKKGANYIGRSDDYKFKNIQKSPNNVMHESMKFDVALAFLRLYPNLKMSFRYDMSFYNVRPDIVIRLVGNNPKDTRFFLVEIERKKTVDRVFNEKITRYEEMFNKMEKNKSHNTSQFTTLFVYTDIWYNVFLRPQQYETVVNEQAQITEAVKRLIKDYCSKLSSRRYLFMPFHNFYKLNDIVWYTSLSYKVSLWKNQSSKNA